MTLQEYIQKNMKQNVFTHALKVNGDGSIYIHPMNHDGDTLDFKIDNNQLIPKNTGLKTIRFNGENMLTHDTEWTYEQIVKFSGGNPDSVYSVTWKRDGGIGRGLTRGKTLELTDKMTINAFITNNA